MGERELLAALAVLSAGACGVAACWVVFGFARVRIRSGRVQRTSGTGSPLRRVLRNGVGLLGSLSASALRIGPFRAGCAECVRALATRGYEASTESLASTVLALGIACLAGGAVLGSAIGGLLAFLSGWYVACSAASHVLSQRREAARDALPDALRTMASCFGVGFTLSQTFHELESSAPEPLGEVFGRARMELAAGSTVAEALDGMGACCEAPSELAFLAVALRVQHQAGGSLQHVLEAARESLENEIEIRRSLRVHTAQARLSARVVVGVTLGLLAALSLLSRDFLAPFFASPLGFAMLIVAVIMQLAGIFAVRRILAVEVA